MSIALARTAIAWLALGAAASYGQTRSDLIEGIFSGPLPSVVPSTSVVANPFEQISGAESVQKLTTSTAVGDNYAYRYNPAEPNQTAVIVWQGHQAMMLGGIAELSDYLVDSGCTVIVGGMPGFAGNAGGDHNSYTSLEPFILPPLAAVNSLSDFDTIAMAGLSGGGWTATVLAAADPRIDYSFEVAGSLPLHLRFGESIGDLEQVLSADLVSYTGMYALGAIPDPNATAARRRVQYLNKNDSCCFAKYGNKGAYGDAYGQTVIDAANAAASVFPGCSVEFYEYDAPGQHGITSEVISDIGSELGLAPPAPAPSTSLVIDDSGAGFSLDHTAGAPNVPYQYDQAVRWDASVFAGGSCHALDWKAVPRVCRYVFDVPPGTYRVLHEFHRSNSRASSASVVAVEGGMDIETWSHNQTGAPGLVELEIGQVVTTGELIIEFRSHAGQNGQLIADTITLEPNGQ